MFYIFLSFLNQQIFWQMSSRKGFLVCMVPARGILIFQLIFLLIHRWDKNMAEIPYVLRSMPRIRIFTEEKAKVVAASWGDRITSIPCRASYFATKRVDEQADLHPILQLVLVQISLFFKSSWCKIASTSRNQ